MNNFITSEAKEVFSIFKRVKNRDFSGNSGIVIKNSVYEFATTLVSKIGSLLFTIILARILMPELFGLYSLALFTIVIFSFFADLGVSTTLVKFVSEKVSKNKNSKAKDYLFYLFKIKFLISTAVLILFLVFAKPLSIYYQKPIFLILLSGSFYLFFMSITGFFQSFFQSLNDFKTSFIKESLFQILRIILIPLFILYLISRIVSGEIILILIFIILGLIWTFLAFFLFFIAKKNPVFLAKKSKLNIKEKKNTNLFLKSLIVFSVFSIIFNYSDLFILGRFVSSEFIGYYQAAMGLILSLSTLIIFSGSLFPVFSRLKGNFLEGGFKKTLRITIFISFILFIISFLFSNLIVKLLYGQEYIQAIPFFRGACFLLILVPLIFLYNGYFLAKGKPEIIKNILIFASLFNLGLNFFLVYFLSQYSNFLAVLGLIFGTVFSNLLYLAGCIWKRKN